MFFVTIGPFQKIYDVRLISAFSGLLLILIYIFRYNFPIFRNIQTLYIFLLFIAVITSLAINFSNDLFIRSFYFLFFGVVTFSFFCIIKIVNIELDSLINYYKKCILLLCFFSLFTISSLSWHTETLMMRSFSDFPILFASQVVFIIPFIDGKYKNLLRIFSLIIIYLCQSRIALILGLLIIIFYILKERNLRLIIFIFIVMMIFSNYISTSALMLKLNELYLYLYSDVDMPIGWSERLRFVLFNLVIQYEQNLLNLLFGNGIDSHHDFISNNLIATEYGLPIHAESSGFHNVYTEFYYELGLIFLVTYILLLLYSVLKIIKNYGIFSNYIIAIFSYFILIFLNGDYSTPHNLFITFLIFYIASNGTKKTST